MTGNETTILNNDIMKKMPDCISVEEAAQYLGISGSAVRWAIKEGRLASKKVIKEYGEVLKRLGEE